VEAWPKKCLGVRNPATTGTQKRGAKAAGILRWVALDTVDGRNLAPPGMYKTV